MFSVVRNLKCTTHRIHSEIWIQIHDLSACRNLGVIYGWDIEPNFFIDLSRDRLCYLESPRNQVKCNEPRLVPRLL